MTAPEATVRAGHTGHGRIIHEGDLLDCLAVNRHHVGASRVWIGCVAMTLPKMAFSQAVQMADRVLEAASFVAGVTSVATEHGEGMRTVSTESALRRSIRRANRCPVPRHAHQDPAGAEWLQKVGAT